MGKRSYSKRAQIFRVEKEAKITLHKITGKKNEEENDLRKTSRKLSRLNIKYGKSIKKVESRMADLERLENYRKPREVSTNSCLVRNRIKTDVMANLIKKRKKKLRKRQFKHLQLEGKIEAAQAKLYEILTSVFGEEDEELTPEEVLDIKVELDMSL